MIPKIKPLTNPLLPLLVKTSVPIIRLTALITKLTGVTNLSLSEVNFKTKAKTKINKSVKTMLTSVALT